MKYKISDMITHQDNKTPVPDLLHFIWIGDSNKLCTQYMEIWKKSNIDKEIIFWYQDDFCFCQYFHAIIMNYVTSLPSVDKISLERVLKNKAFEYIYPNLNRGLRFDDLIFCFFEKNNIPFKPMEKNERGILRLEAGLTIKNIGDLFAGEFSAFRKFYYYEIILRGNLASASDIARLIIIYKYGGTYIDMDTLPCTDNVFKTFNAWKMSTGYDEDDFIKLFKTKKILNKLGLLNVTDEEYINNYCHRKETNFYGDILNMINCDMSKFTQDDILPLGSLYVHKNLMSIGAVRDLKGIYFNSVISSHPFSKTIKIILLTMKKRYVFLERNDCIFNDYNGGGTCSYLTRILTWRTELITKNYCVTSALTGPGLIVEVLLGLAYELMDPQYLTSPILISRNMHNEAIGIAFFRHNLYTPEGLCSAWRT